MLLRMHVTGNVVVNDITHDLHHSEHWVEHDRNRQIAHAPLWWQASQTTMRASSDQGRGFWALESYLALISGTATQTQHPTHQPPRAPRWWPARKHRGELRNISMALGLSTTTRRSTFPRNPANHKPHPLCSAKRARFRREVEDEGGAPIPPPPHAPAGKLNFTRAGNCVQVSWFPVAPSPRGAGAAVCKTVAP